MADRPVVAICIDGFDPEYLEACKMPNMKEITRKGFLKIGQCMMPSVTNVNNVSLVTASYPEIHGICSNYWLNPGTGKGIYLESNKYIRAETMFQRAKKQGKRSVLVTSKDKLRTLIADGATHAVSSEKAPLYLTKRIGEAPHIYSLEVNGWAIRAASHIMSLHPADVVYITTTDYAMHTYAPDHPEAQRHMTILDDAIGELVETHPDITLFITADHGMSRKTRMVNLKQVLADHGIIANPVPIIKDRYVLHHANLGGCIYLYLQSSDVKEALKVLRGTSGVEEAFSRKEAAVKFKLHGERIGDIVVTGEKNVVFGDPAEVELPSNLRSHGSTYEMDIPIIGYNGDFTDFSFEENRDIGRYIFERVLKD